MLTEKLYEICFMFVCLWWSFSKVHYQKRESEKEKRENYH